MRGPDFCRSQPQKTQKQHKIGRLKARNFTKKRINFAKRENVCIFALPKRKKWSDGRVARHSSAKAATAVRIRFRPPRINVREPLLCAEVFLLRLGVMRVNPQPTNRNKNILLRRTRTYPSDCSPWEGRLRG